MRWTDGLRVAAPTRAERTGLAVHGEKIATAL
jgi:hypothetical protein